MAAAAPPRQVAAQIVYPALTGRVVDRAELLPPDVERALAVQLERAETKTRHQMVIVTVPTLGGRTIEDYGVGLGRSWGIGRKNVDDGVLLIVAPKERKVRIEVGYGLEGVLRDPEAARIIRDDILPHFRRGDMAGGIQAGTTAILRQIDVPGATP